MFHEVTKLGVSFSRPKERWYGEPAADALAEFMQKAAQIRLDEMTSPQSSELLSTRLWRRYGKDAFTLLDRIAADRTAAEVLIERAEYLRCEIELAAEKEMIERLEDFLRRRSKIALVVRHEDIARAPGLREACRILFADQAEAKLCEWLESSAS
jgi:glycerol-3-phosphate dehydrogenase